MIKKKSANGWLMHDLPLGCPQQGQRLQLLGWWWLFPTNRTADCPPCHDKDLLGSPWCHGNQLNTQLSFTDSDLKLPEGKFISCWLLQICSVMTTSSEKHRHIKTLSDQGLSGRPVKGHSHWWWTCTAASCLSCMYWSGRFNGQNKASREDVPILTVIFFFYY